MGGVGLWELGLIALLFILIANPKRLPIIAKKIGTWLGKLRKLKNQIDKEP